MVIIMFAGSFQILNALMLLILTSTYVLYGGMPPCFTMVIGFWILVYTNFVAIYMTLLSKSTFQRNYDIHWINKMTFIGIFVCAICFMVGAILALIKPTENAMMTYCQVYWVFNKKIPPFLDKLQEQYKCCGIKNYTDYGRKDWADQGYGTKGFLVYREANPNDDFFYEFVNDITLNRTVYRNTTGVRVWRSCCVASKAKFARMSKTYPAMAAIRMKLCNEIMVLIIYPTGCGDKVEYTNSQDKFLQILQNRSAIEKIHDPTMGCFEKYKSIVYSSSSGYLELSLCILLIQYVPIIQCGVHLILLWFHRMALKTIRQVNYWLPELLDLQITESAETKAKARAKKKKKKGSKEVEKKFSRKQRRSLSEITRNMQMAIFREKMDNEFEKKQKISGPNADAENKP